MIRVRTWRNLTAACIINVSSATYLTSARAADVQTYTSLADWQAAVQGSTIISNNLSKEFSYDISFAKSAITTGAGDKFRQLGSGSYGYFRNFVDVPPLQFSDNDGNTNISLYTKFKVSSVRIVFDKPVYAAGANFFGAQTGELENMILLAADDSKIAVIPVAVNTGFFGFVVTPRKAVYSIQFQSQTQNPDPSVGQGFSIENPVRALYAGH